MKVAILLLLALVLVSLEVNAIAVASDYLANGTLELIEGSSKIYSIRLQNPTDNEVGIKLDYDKTFMKVVDYKGVYTLQPKETGYKILFNVTALQKPGEYIVGYTVSEVEPSGGGGLPIRLKINRNFKLKIVKAPNKFHINYDYVAVAVIVLVFLLYAFRKKRAMKHSRAKPKKFL